MSNPGTNSGSGITSPIATAENSMAAVDPQALQQYIIFQQQRIEEMQQMLQKQQQQGTMATVPKVESTANTLQSAAGSSGGAESTQRRVTIELKPLWKKTFADVAPNPLLGYVHDTSDLTKEDYLFYCDACQKGFYSHPHYAAHLEQHIYCDHPGCNFTCRKDKEWKMDIHVQTLHNIAGAPNLADSKAYVEARKKHFPTQEAVQQKVEELYYKAAQGQVVPDERRRWLKQHGIYLRRHHSGGGVLDTRERRPPRERAPSDNRQQQQQQQKQDEETSGQPGDRAQGEATEESKDPSGAQADDAGQPCYGRGASGRGRGGSGSSLRGIPRGMLSKGQLIQQVREQYMDARRAPTYYVCNRCGKKGHWVEDCPTLGNGAYDTKIVWGEGPKERPVRDASHEVGSTGEVDQADCRKSNVGEEEGGSIAGNDNEAMVERRSNDNAIEAVYESSASSRFSSSGDSDSSSSSGSSTSKRRQRPKLVPLSKLRKDDGEDAHGSVLPPGRGADRGGMRGGRGSIGYSRGRGGDASGDGATRQRYRRRPYVKKYPPTLYEKLTEDERLNSKSLVLQALRFFVQQNFFDDEPRSAAEGTTTSADADGSDGKSQSVPCEEV